MFGFSKAECRGKLITAQSFFEIIYNEYVAKFWNAKKPEEKVNESDTDFENEIIVKQSLIIGKKFWLFENKGLYKLSSTGEAWGGISFDARINLIPGENTSLNIGRELF